MKARQFLIWFIKQFSLNFESHSGIPDPERLPATNNMLPKRDAVKLRSFLRMVNYYTSFLPGLHYHRTPLNKLLKRDAKRSWIHECQAAFNKLKFMADSDVLLCHFDRKRQMAIAVEAPNYGISSAMKKSFAHVSRPLTQAEKNCRQIGKRP